MDSQRGSSSTVERKAQEGSLAPARACSGAQGMRN